MVKVVDKLIICADSTEANRLFRELGLKQGNQGYTNRLVAVVPVDNAVESHMFRTLRQLDSLYGMLFDVVSITDNTYKNGSIAALNKAIYLKGMLTAPRPRGQEETL